VCYVLGGLEQRLFVARYQAGLSEEQDIAAFLREHRLLVGAVTSDLLQRIGQAQHRD
jgi:hypothetical protein